MSPTELLERCYPMLLHPGQPVTVTPATPGFSGARVFRVEIEQSAFCVRQWPTGIPRERLQAIHGLLRHLGGHTDVPIPVPIPSADGNSVVAWEGHLWQVEPWLPGEADFDQQPTEVRLASAMTGLAKWHHLAAQYEPPERDTDWLLPCHEDKSPTVASRLHSLVQWRADLNEAERRLMLEPDDRFRSVGQQLTIQFRRLGNSIGRELQQVESLSVRQQPCIRDLWHDHLLFCNDQLTGIIDFGAVKTDSVACDLSRLLGSLFGTDASAWKRALDAYEQTRPLTTAEHQLLRPLNRSGILLSGMTWLQRRAEDSIASEQMPRIIERLQRIVGQLELL
jgi:Ser/Thr protein kinase RdoA (MazF antagonist)